MNKNSEGQPANFSTSNEQDAGLRTHRLGVPPRGVFYSKVAAHAGRFGGDHIVKVNHFKNIMEIKTPMEEVYFASMRQVYPWNYRTNFTVDLVRQVAKSIMKRR